MKIYEIISETSVPAPDNLLALIKDTAKHLDPAARESLIFNSGFIAKNTFRFMTFVKWIGAYEIACTYLAQVALVNKAIKERQMPESDRMPAYRILVEETVVALAASGSIVKVIRMLIGFTVVGRLAAWVAGGAATIATLGVFGGPAVLEILATTAASIWLQQWVQTKEGKEVIANCVMYAIDPALTWLWNQGPGRFISSVKTHNISDQGAKTMGKKDDPLGDLGDKVNDKLTGTDTDVDSISSKANAAKDAVSKHFNKNPKAPMPTSGKFLDIDI